MEDLQEKIKLLRNKMGWSQEDLARQIDVSLSTVQRWEGKGSNPWRPTRRKLEKLFKRVNVEESIAK